MHGDHTYLVFTQKVLNDIWLQKNVQKTKIEIIKIKLCVILMISILGF